MSNRLTAAEVSFVALEDAGIPMHVGAVALLEGGATVTMEALRSHVVARVRRVPKFHQVVSPAQAQPISWAPAGRVDFASHLFHHDLPAPGRKDELNALCARIHEEPLDRSRPLWEMHLIDGLSQGRQAVLTKTHHALSDGLAGIEIAETLFDPAPGRPRPTVPSMRFGENGAPPAVAALQDLVGLAYTAAGGPMAAPGPFNAPVGPARSFATARLRMDVVIDLKRRFGGSIDDVVVAIVASGIGNYLRNVGYPSIPKALRAMLPVSTIASTPGARLGNHVSAVFINLPTMPSDIAAIVRDVAAQKATLRTAHAAGGGAMLVEAAALLPHPLHRALLRFVSTLPFAHLVLSDVPGPAETLYLLGRRIAGFYPLMPLARDLGLSIATISMGGTIGVGVTADPAIVPEVRRLAAAIGRAGQPRPT